MIESFRILSAGSFGNTRLHGCRPVANARAGSNLGFLSKLGKREQLLARLFRIRRGFWLFSEGWAVSSSAPSPLAEVPK